MTGLLSKVLEIEVKIGHDGRSHFAYGLDVLDDRGTKEKSAAAGKDVRKNEPDNAFTGARWEN